MMAAVQNAQNHAAQNGGSPRSRFSSPKNVTPRGSFDDDDHDDSVASQEDGPGTPSSRASDDGRDSPTHTSILEAQKAMQLGLLSEKEFDEIRADYVKALRRPAVAQRPALPDVGHQRNNNLALSPELGHHHSNNITVNARGDSDVTVEIPHGRSTSAVSLGSDGVVQAPRFNSSSSQLHWDTEKPKLTLSPAWQSARDKMMKAGHTEESSSRFADLFVQMSPDDGDGDHDPGACSDFHAVEYAVVCCTFGIFAIGTLVLIVAWAFSDEHGKHTFTGTFFVCAIASAAYWAKVTHMGDIKYNGKSIPVARYIDWITTTPIMLYELCTIGGAPYWITMMVVGCDLLMLTFGIIAAAITHEKTKNKNVKKNTWFAMAGFFYILMCLTLQYQVGAVYAVKKPKHVQDLFVSLETLTVVVWSFYPVVVLLGRAHYGKISHEMEDLLLCILDVVSKIGMEGFVLASVISGAAAH